VLKQRILGTLSQRTASMLTEEMDFLGRIEPRRLDVREVRYLWHFAAGST
jgi:flagellar motor switch protein FliG